MPCQQQGLKIGHKPPWNLFSKKRMGQDIFFPFLPALKENASSLLIEKNAAVFPIVKIRFLKNPVIDASKDKAVRNARPEFFHQIQSK